MGDCYQCFAELAAGESLGIDYQLVIRDRGSTFAAIAPHGGYIEPGTSELGAAIAGDDHSYYAFEGLRCGRPHRDLHITSHRFDEPLCVALVRSCQSVIAVHGRADRKDPSTTWLGGRDQALRLAITAALQKAGFEAQIAVGALAGNSAANICNRTANCAGVQLELPRTLRVRLLENEKQMAAYSGAIRACLVQNHTSRLV